MPPPEFSANIGAMRFYALFVAVFVGVAALFAQDATMPAPPAEVGVPFYLDSAAGQLKKLTTEPYKEHNGSGPFVYNAPQTVQVEGIASAFRVPYQSKVVFVFDATTVPRLYHFTVHHKKREFQFATASPRNETRVEGLPITVSRYRETAYQFSADSPLEIGEYAILFGSRVYTFGVDAPK